MINALIFIVSIAFINCTERLEPLTTLVHLNDQVELVSVPKLRHIVKVIDFQIVNRYYRWKPQNNNNTCTGQKYFFSFIRNKMPLALPFADFPPMTKQVTNSFLY